MAVRFDAATDALSRGANFPDQSAVTVCGWASRSGAGGGTLETLFALRNNAFTQSLVIQHLVSSGQIRVGGTGTANIRAVPANGVPFFWALVGAGTGANQVTGYIRTFDENTFTSATVTTATITEETLELFNANLAGTQQPWNGLGWNVKCWNRALTVPELLVESFYRAVKFSSSINFHYELESAAAVYDISGNVRDPTVGGTLTTDDGCQFGMWRPRRRRFMQPAPPTPRPSLKTSSGLLLETGTGQVVRL